MSIINLLFWNLAKNNIDKYIIGIIKEKNVDIAIFSEYSGINISNILANLNNEYLHYSTMGGCNKVTIIAKRKYDIKIRREADERFVIYSVECNDEKYILAGLHLQDNLHSDSDVRKIEIRDLVSYIQEVEKNLNHSNTIVIGDFNASPFDDEMIQKDAFNAVLFKNLILKAEYTTFGKRKYRRFYNPMLDFISEDNANYGSFYYSSGLKTLYWYCYDQIIIRKPLISYLHSLEYCKTIGNKKLIKDIIPDKSISDHLPLFVRFERRIENG